MHLENPKEYISLVKGEEDNFSEVYGVRYVIFGLSVDFYGPSRELEVPAFRVTLGYLTSGTSNLGACGHIRT